MRVLAAVVIVSALFSSCQEEEVLPMKKVEVPKQLNTGGDGNGNSGSDPDDADLPTGS